MFTSSVFARVKEQPVSAIVIIWRQRHGCWDFFTRSPADEAESIVATDAFLTGLDRTHYKVTQG